MGILITVLSWTVLLLFACATEASEGNTGIGGITIAIGIISTLITAYTMGVIFSLAPMLYIFYAFRMMVDYDTMSE